MTVWVVKRPVIAIDLSAFMTDSCHMRFIFMYHLIWKSAEEELAKSVYVWDQQRDKIWNPIEMVRITPSLDEGKENDRQIKAHREENWMTKGLGRSPFRPHSSPWFACCCTDWQSIRHGFLCVNFHKRQPTDEGIQFDAEVSLLDIDTCNHYCAFFVRFGEGRALKLASGSSTVARPFNLRFANTKRCHNFCMKKANFPNRIQKKTFLVTICQIFDEGWRE